MNTNDAIDKHGSKSIKQCFLLQIVATIKTDDSNVCCCFFALIINAFFRLNMTEKLFTGTLNNNKNKNKEQKKKKNAFFVKIIIAVSFFIYLSGVIVFVKFTLV